MTYLAKLLSITAFLLIHVTLSSQVSFDVRFSGKVQDCTKLVETDDLVGFGGSAPDADCNYLEVRSYNYFPSQGPTDTAVFISSTAGLTFTGWGTVFARAIPHVSISQFDTIEVTFDHFRSYNSTLGTYYDCAGAPNGYAIYGFPCDDGDPNTTGDSWDINCNCVGSPPDLLTPQFILRQDVDCATGQPIPFQLQAVTSYPPGALGNIKWSFGVAVSYPPDTFAQVYHQAYPTITYQPAYSFLHMTITNGDATAGHVQALPFLFDSNGILDTTGIIGSLPPTQIRVIDIADTCSGPIQNTHHFDLTGTVANCRTDTTMLGDVAFYPVSNGMPSGITNGSGFLVDSTNCSITSGSLYFDPTGWDTVFVQSIVNGSIYDSIHRICWYRDIFDANSLMLSTELEHDFDIGSIDGTDCTGNIGGFNIMGFPCDDGDPSTVNDRWDANCNCVGGSTDPCIAQFVVRQDVDSTSCLPIPYSLQVITFLESSVDSASWWVGNSVGGVVHSPQTVIDQEYPTFSMNSGQALLLNVVSGGCTARTGQRILVDQNGYYDPDGTASSVPISIRVIDIADTCSGTSSTMPVVHITGNAANCTMGNVNPNPGPWDGVHYECVSYGGGAANTMWLNYEQIDTTTCSHMFTTPFSPYPGDTAMASIIAYDSYDGISGVGYQEEFGVLALPDTLFLEHDLHCRPTDGLDCTGILHGTNVHGFPCDDGDPNTTNDTWDANCNCVGQAVDPCFAQFIVRQDVDTVTCAPIPFQLQVVTSLDLSSVDSVTWSFFGYDQSGGSFDTIFSEPYPSFSYPTGMDWTYKVGLHVYSGSTTKCIATYGEALAVDVNGIYDPQHTGTTQPLLVRVIDIADTCTGAPPSPCTSHFLATQAYDTTGGVVTPLPNQVDVWNQSFSASGTMTYLWDFGDGASSTVAYPSHIYANAGPYNLCLTITDPSGCSDMHCDTIAMDSNGIFQRMIINGNDDRSTGFTINVRDPNAVGIEEVDPVVSNYWPNPAQDELNIQLSTSGRVNVTIADLSGRTMLQYSSTASQGGSVMNIPLDELPKGMYLVQVLVDGQHSMFRFVKADQG